ncbi:Eco57I restriction-modification methylase domain-containing protein [Virgibacillus sp. L01]|uniref:Eco57I restriction-modification methylase domain-containing protein n=1 Tax=Virgibacillus sp. L01 TaxID=3457429 RepID=UPI003FD3DA42
MSIKATDSKGVTHKTSSFSLDYKEIKKRIFALSFLLFNQRKKLYPERNTSDIYEETISILTDLLFILLANQRNLIKLCEGTDITFNLKMEVSNLRNQDITNEKWDEELHSHIKELNKVMQESNLKIDILSILVEDSWEKSNLTVLANKNGSSNNRREKGSYYTKDELIDVIVKNTIDPLCSNKTIKEILNLKIIDPAVGSGSFLLSALKRILFHIKKLSKKDIDNNSYKKEIINNCLYGVDINPNALKSTIYSLWLEVGDSQLPISSVKRNFVEGDSLLATDWNLNKNNYDEEKLILLNYYLVGTLLNGDKVRSLEEEYEDFFVGKLRGKLLDDKLIERGRNSKTFIWQVSFKNVYKNSDGFDGVIGNPPWNKVKAHLKEFFVHYDLTIKGMQGKALKKYVEEKLLSQEYYKKLWNDHKKEVSRYSKAVNNSPQFQHQAYVINGRKQGGDRDLYKYFLELAYNLTCEKGYVGYIIPGAFTQSEGTTGMRELLFNQNNIQLLFTVENRDKIFPIDSRYKYALLIFKKFKTTETDIKCRFMLRSLEEVNNCLKNNDLLKIPSDLIEQLSPNYKTLPDIKSQYEVDLLKKIYKVHPLINSTDGWKIQFNRELDMTNDSNLFVHKESINEGFHDYYPLYEGRMLNQFDFAAKKYLFGEGRQAKWQDLSWDSKKILPHFYVPKNEVDKKNIEANKARPGYCDIAGQTNERAVQTALIPGYNVAGNKVPTVRLTPNDIAHNLLWIALTNSFVFDWLMRLRMSTTINFFHWNQLPLPLIDIFSDSGKKLVINSAKLTLLSPYMDEEREELIQFYNGEIKSDEIKPVIYANERQEIRAEIDAMVANIYGLNLPDIAFVLYQFPLLDRKQPGLPGDNCLYNRGKGSYITRDLVLYQYLSINNQPISLDIIEVYKQCSINVEEITGGFRRIDDRVNKAMDLNAIAYTPG